MAAKKVLDVNMPGGRAEHDALDREYRDHALWLVSIARRQLGSAGDAEDVVHEAYIRAARYPAVNRTKPRSLLARILRNLIRDRARACRREQAGQRALASADVRAGVHDAEQHSLLALKQIILGMPGTYQEVFLLSRFTALTQAEIAARLGISLKTVEWRLAKALAYCAERIPE